MSNFWRRQHWRSLQATWQTFGLSRELVTAALRDPALRAGTRLSLGLDNVFFPSWREAVVKEPVFLVGHPDPEPDAASVLDASRRFRRLRVLGCSSLP